MVPDTVHTGRVFDEKLTGKPELAIADTVKVGAPKARFDKAPNVMV
jgi:hypothetical protein